MGDYLSSYLYHEILYAITAQEGCHLVHSQPLGYSAEVEDDSGVGLFHHVISDAHLLPSHQLKQTVHGCAVGPLAVLESKSPCIYQGSHGDVKRTSCGFADGCGLLEYHFQHGIGMKVLSRVYLAYSTLLVEHGE